MSAQGRSQALTPEPFKGEGSSVSGALLAHGLSVVRGSREVLRGVDLALHARQWTALLGANGQGKSSLLAALAGLLPTAAGRVVLQGRLLVEWTSRERAERLAWLAQQGQAEGELAALDVVRLGRLPQRGLWGDLQAADEAAVASAMAITDCAALAPRRLSALSGGERQRVLLARLLATEAPVMLLDEPTTHLDAPHQRALLGALRERAAQGACVVTALHDVTQALAADRVVLLTDGRVAADGAPGDPRLHRALEAAFAAAFSIVAINHLGRQRWVALPH